MPADAPKSAPQCPPYNPTGAKPCCIGPSTGARRAAQSGDGNNDATTTVATAISMEPPPQPPCLKVPRAHDRGKRPVGAPHAYPLPKSGGR